MESEKIIKEQYLQMFIWPKVEEFTRRYIAEANNCFFTVSELCDDFNESNLMYGFEPVTYQQFYGAVKRVRGLVHKECRGDEHGKFRLTGTTYMQIKRMNELPDLKYSWNERGYHE